MYSNITSKIEMMRRQERMGSMDVEEERLLDERIKEYGITMLYDKKEGKHISMISIIGEIEGHDISPATNKTTKYEHLLPQLALVEHNPNIKGLLVINNTSGGDVSAGLALAEMIASISKPSVSLVIGDSHSIGVPLAVATDYSFISPTGTMIIHPVRMGGMVIGVRQTFDYFKIIQDRISGFVANHSQVKKEEFEEMMVRQGLLTKDLGTILVGEDAVKAGVINEVGGIHSAIEKLKSMIN